MPNVSREWYEDYERKRRAKMGVLGSGPGPKLQELQTSNTRQQNRKNADTDRAKRKKKNAGNHPKFKVSVYFKLPDYRVRDCSGMLETIMDCLVDAGVIPDDRWRIVPEQHVYAGLAEDGHVGAKVIVEELKQ